MSSNYYLYHRSYYCRCCNKHLETVTIVPIKRQGQLEVCCFHCATHNYGVLDAKEVLLEISFKTITYSDFDMTD